MVKRELGIGLWRETPTQVTENLILRSSKRPAGEPTLPSNLTGKYFRLALFLLMWVVTVGAGTLQTGQDPALGSMVGAGNQATPPTQQSFPELGVQEFLISPDDLLEINVLDVPQVSRQYRVSPGGEIILPLLSNPIRAVGLTPARLSGIIAERLRSAGLVSKPYVTVEVRQSRTHSVAVVGAVKKPQIYPLFGRTTLLDVLSQAEGLAEEAGSTATITRGEVALRVLSQGTGQAPATSSEPPPRVATVDLKQLLETGDPALNVDVYPGDRVMVQRAGIVYVVGAVNRPGGFPLSSDQEEMTVLKAIALAQDLKSTAIRQKAVVIRKDPEAPEGREEIPIDLRRVLAGRAPDLAMQPSDILFVPDSTGKKALRRAAEAIVQTTTGIIIWRR